MLKCDYIDGTILFQSVKQNSQSYLVVFSLILLHTFLLFYRHFDDNYLVRLDSFDNLFNLRKLEYL